VREALGRVDRSILRNAPLIVGVDEVGRGSLAGPVAVAAVAWATIPRRREVQDSKRMTPLARERTSAWIRNRCARWIIVEVWPETIDRLGISYATRLAMESAVESLASPGCVVIADAMKLRSPDVEVRSEIRADSRYFCVASASIIAKVHRDRLMVHLAARYPQWSWCKNMGYGTVEHRRALSQTGPSFLHRNSFSWRPVLP